METLKDIFAFIGVMAVIILIAGIVIAWIINKWTNETHRPTTESDQIKTKQ